jgi:hypothetical protein
MAKKEVAANFAKSSVSDIACLLLSTKVSYFEKVSSVPYRHGSSVNAVSVFLNLTLAPCVICGITFTLFCYVASPVTPHRTALHERACGESI